MKQYKAHHGRMPLLTPDMEARVQQEIDLGYTQCVVDVSIPTSCDCHTRSSSSTPSEEAITYPTTAFALPKCRLC
jgi:hypothetical protein